MEGEDARRPRTSGPWERAGHALGFSAESVRKAAVFRALALGDTLCALPAMRAIRQSLPHAEITLIGLPWARPFADLYPSLFDRFIAFPGFPGLPESPFDARAFPRFLIQCQEERYDLAIQLHGSGMLSNPVVLLMDARTSCGFHEPGVPAPDSRTFFPYPGTGHEIHRLMALPLALGFPSSGDQLEFPLGRPSEALCSLMIEKGLERRPYVCVHPGARLPARRWHPRRFSVVADHFAEHGYMVLFTGHASEKGLIEQVRSGMRLPGSSVDLSGRTDLSDLACLLARARLLVCNDTGVSHLGSAVRVPSVVVVLSSDPARWAPLDRRRHRAVHSPVACRPCAYVHCPLGHLCAERVSVTDVVQAATSLLEEFAKESNRDCEEPCKDYAS